MEEEIKKRFIENVMSRVIAKNIHICKFVCANLYFGGGKGGLND